MSVKIRLKRMGKIRSPHYRIVVADSRTKRDGRAIEEIGLYHPTREPSLIEIESDRVQYWLGVGAQPTEQVLALLKVKGEWQKFKGLPGAEGTYREPGSKQDDRSGFDEAKALNLNEAKTLKTKKAEAKAAEPKAEKADKPEKSEPKAEKKAEKKAEPEAEKPKDDAPAAEAPAAEAPAAEAPAAEAPAEKAEAPAEPATEA